MILGSCGQTDGLLLLYDLAWFLSLNMRTTFLAHFVILRVERLVHIVESEP